MQDFIFPIVLLIICNPMSADRAAAASVSTSFTVSVQVAAPSDARAPYVSDRPIQVPGVREYPTATMPNIQALEQTVLLLQLSAKQGMAAGFRIVTFENYSAHTIELSF
jgi:hypothetical protein